MRTSLVILVLFFLNCHPYEKESGNQREVTEHAKKEVVAFVYHRFGDNKYPSTNISTVLFEQHLSYLKTHEFKVLTFGEAIDYINNPAIPYSKKVACITIDDGYKSFQSNAVPLLQKYNYKATVFINSESVGGGTYMDWNDLKEIHDQGIEIGNHSHGHAYFLNTAKNERIEFFKNDVQKCQEEIHKHLGFYPDIFAYPYGEFDLEMKTALDGMDFKGAAAQNSGVMYHCDNFAFARFPMAGSYASLDGFIEKANMKALRANCATSSSFVLEGDNPPTITIEIDSSGADLSRLNCFTSGDCETAVNGNLVTIKAKNKLNGRRTLYTITAPSKKGNAWYWYSHLWIRPEIHE